MKTFRFSLEQMMQWRAQCAESERIALDRLQDQKAQLAARRRAAEDELAELRTSAGEASGITGFELAGLAEYTRALRSLGERIEAEETAFQDRIAEQRSKCVEADRNFRLLEKCKEKRLAEWERQLDRELESGATESFLAGRARQMRST